MKAIRTLSLSLLGAALLAAPVFAAINPNAPGASHGLENSAVDLHDYLHDNYPSSYGAHGMENVADDLHSMLHDWDHGDASEADVLALVDDAQDAFDDMTDQLNDEGLLTGEAMDIQVHKRYQAVKADLALVKALTNGN